MTTPEKLTGPVALVTGGAIRVGAALSTALVEAGYRVWLHHHHSVSAAAELAASSDAILGPVAADLRDSEERRRLCERVLAPEGPGGGRLDLLVNNAASFEQGEFESRSDEDLVRVLGLNLVAPLSLTRQLAPALRAANPVGSVVNILDLGAIDPWPDRLDHSVAKAGLAAATRGLAGALAPVRVNAVAPGTVLPPAGMEPRVDRIPRGAVGAPQDVAAAVLFLASAPHISGHILVLDGGQTAVRSAPYRATDD